MYAQGGAEFRYRQPFNPRNDLAQQALQFRRVVRAHGVSDRYSQRRILAIPAGNEARKFPDSVFFLCRLIMFICGPDQ